MLMSDDFPTFERPMSANSGRADSGHEARSGELALKVAVRIFTIPGDGELLDTVSSPGFQQTP